MLLLIKRESIKKDESWLAGDRRRRQAVVKPLAVSIEL